MSELHFHFLMASQNENYHNISSGTHWSKAVCRLLLFSSRKFERSLKTVYAQESSLCEPLALTLRKIKEKDAFI